jgi:hypothetical protein
VEDDSESLLENTPFRKPGLFPSSDEGRETPTLLGPLERSILNHWTTHLEVEVEVNLRPTVSRPICLGIRRPSEICDQFFFLLEISFRQLRVWYFVAPSLTRERVCNLLYNCFWALPEQPLLDRSPAEVTTIFYYHI